MGPDKRHAFEAIDLFSKSFEFNFDGREKFKSKFGGYFTVLTIMVILYCIWVLGNEILFRNMPKDYQVNIIHAEPKNLSLKVPFAFMVQDQRGNAFKNYDKYITFEAYYYNLARRNDNFEEVEKRSVSLRKCIESDFSEELVDTFKNLRLEYAICLGENNITLGGDFNLNFVKFLAVEVRPCYNNTERDYCAPKEETFSFLNLKNLVISVKQEKILYTSRNYTKPVTKFISEDNILIDPYILNFPKYLMEEFSVDTDSGYIGTDNSSEQFYQFGSMINDIITAFDDHGKLPDKLLLYEYSFFESLNAKIQVRSYLKLTEMLASIGGILKIYLMIVSFLFHAVYDRLMYERIILKLFQFEKQNANMKTETNIKSEINLKNNLKSTLSNKNLNSELNLRNSKKIKNINEIPIPKLVKFKMTSQTQNIENKLKTIIRKNIININNTKTRAKSMKKMLSTCSHIILVFAPCCLKQSLRRQKLQFDSLVNFTHSYTDILKLIKHLYEFERLKFILFDKKQLSVFQNISLIEYPFLESNHQKISKKYKLINDLDAQNNKCLEFFT